MDIDKHPAIPGQMGIQSIPAVIAFVNGQPVDGFMGALPESQVNAFHRAADQGQARRRRRRPVESRRRGARGRRRRRARPSIYGADSGARNAGSLPALAGLARAYVATGAIDEAQADARAGSGGQAQRRRCQRRAAPRSSSPNRRKSARPDRRARTESRRQSARPSGALRSRGRAERAGQREPRRPTICSRS